MYNKHYLDIVKKETEWLIVCDIDEYIYSRNGYKKITNVLNELPINVKQIWIPWKIFWGNGHKNQPKHIIESFNKHYRHYKKDHGYGKSILRTSQLIDFDIHVHYIYDSPCIYTSNGELYDNYDFTYENVNTLNLHLNHYMLMSEEYYREIKCKRGGPHENYIDVKYTMETYYVLDAAYSKNSVVDDELKLKKYD